MPFTCSAEERQKDGREDAKSFFLPRRRRSADGASLGCTTNFALDVYFALQFYYLKLLLAPLKVLQFWAFKLPKLLQNFMFFDCVFCTKYFSRLYYNCTFILTKRTPPEDPHQKTPTKRPQPKVLKQWTQNKSPQPKDP